MSTTMSGALTNLLRLRSFPILPVLLSASLTAFCDLADAADAKYIYDEAGELTGVVSPTGESAKYSYDAAGNIVSIQRGSSSQLSILEFSPNSGSVGSIVTILGSAFETTPAGNTVTIGGVAAVVISAAADQLTITVPPGATSGPISVTTAVGTVATTGVFTVNSAQFAPQITGFTPAIVAAGDVVTVTGANFDAAGNNVVRINGNVALVSSSQSNQISIVVPNGATSGKIDVVTPQGTGSSANDLFVVPGTNTSWMPANVVSAVRASEGASPLVQITTAGKLALIVFDGMAGDAFSIYVSNLTFSAGTAASCGAYIRIYGPGSDFLKELWMTTTTTTWTADIPPLPISGTYTAVVSPSTTCAPSFNVAISKAPVVQVDPYGSAVTLTTLTLGQDARFVFSGAAGQVFTAWATSIPTPAGSAGSVGYSLGDPDGGNSGVGSIALGAAGFLNLPPLPMTGTYNLIANPPLNATAQISVLLSAEVSGNLSTAGDAFPLDIARKGQNARLTINGTAGQVFGLSFATAQFTQNGYASTCNASVKVWRPNGAVIAVGTLTAPGATYDLPSLPENGAYSVTVDPVDACTLSTTVALVAPGTKTIDINGQAISVATTVPGQAVRYGFSGSAGQIGLSLATLNIAQTPTASSASIRVIRPDGTLLSSATPTSTFAILDLAQLTMSGTYAIEIVPAGMSTISATLFLSSEVTGDVPSSGSVFNLGVGRVGQNARLTFSGIAGQSLALSFGNVVLANNGYAGNCSGNIVYKIYKPDGSFLSSWNLLSVPGVTVDLPTLTSTGTHTITMDMYDRCTGSANVSINTVGTNSIAVNGAASVIANPTAGQAVRFGFSGTVGKTISIYANNVVVTPSTAGSVSLRLIKPSGGASFHGSTASNGGSAILQPPALTETGTYIIETVPPGNATATINVIVSQDIEQTIPTNGVAQALAIDRVAQNARLTFAGTSGQALTLGLANNTFAKNGYTGTCTVYIKLYSPTGAQLASYVTSAASVNYTLPTLASTGDFLLLVDPVDRCTLSTSITLQ